MKRFIPSIKLNNNDKNVSFGTCVVRQIHEERLTTELTITLSYDLKREELRLRHVDNNNAAEAYESAEEPIKKKLKKEEKRKENGLIPLWHSDHHTRALSCPFDWYSGRDSDGKEMINEKKKNLLVGVCVILEKVENNVKFILLTQRSLSLRLFPGVWVVPGGHVEQGESLEEAGIRELKEETGMIASIESSRVFAVYESGFPLEHDGCQTHHHLVVYVRANPIDSNQSLSEAVQKASDAHEIERAIWLSEKDVRYLLNVKPGTTKSGDEARYVECVHRRDEQRVEVERRALSSLQTCDSHEYGERLAISTELVLRHWLAQQK